MEVVFNAFGHIEVDYPLYVLLVNSHPERYSGNEDSDGIFFKAFVDLLSLHIRKSSMVRLSRYSIILYIFSSFLLIHNKPCFLNALFCILFHVIFLILRNGNNILNDKLTLMNRLTISVVLL